MTLTGHTDKTKIFCLSFKTNLNDNVIIYYIDKDLNSDEIVLKLIDELFRPKYKDIRLFCYNLGGFYIVFIIKVLNNYNDNNENDKYIYSTIFRDDKILKIKKSKNVNDNKRSFTISDSYSITIDKLSNLAFNFQVDTLSV